MYDSTEVQPQDETSFEQFMAECPSEPMTPTEFAAYDAWTSEQEAKEAHRLGWCPFTSNLTASEYLATLPTLTTV